MGRKAVLQSGVVYSECFILFMQVDSHPAKVKQRNILEILTASINDHPSDSSCMREARYMLIIDPSEDNSAIHLLFTFGVLDWKNTRVYVCSSFPRDSDLQNVSCSSLFISIIFAL